jgi:hypothetical protein
MEIYEKLLTARNLIKETKVKKEGKNTFSNYEYFTPSQISLLCHDACTKMKLLSVYSLKKHDSGYIATLTIYDAEKPEKSIIFEIPTSIPEIKATNEAQKLGGAVTYSHRYLLMLAFDIVDNSLDFDSTENTEKQAKKQPEKKEIIKPLPPITDNFYKVWNKEIELDNTVILKGVKYQLSDDQLKQCTVYLQQLEELYYDEQIKEQSIVDTY